VVTFLPITPRQAMEGIAVIIGMWCKVVMLNVTAEIWLKADETRLKVGRICV
jgi:hypothetical protein